MPLPPWPPPHLLPPSRPAPTRQVLRNAILMTRRPEHFLHLLQHTRLRGESEQAAAARWRRVMVRRLGGGCGGHEVPAQAGLHSGRSF